MNRIWIFMKKNYQLLLLVVAVSLGLWGFMSRDKDNPEKNKLLIELITEFINHYHFSPAEVNDKFSKGVYKDYIKALDPTKRFFLESDINDFSKYETLIDDQIKNRDLTFFMLTYERYKARIKDTEDFYESILDKPFDYSKSEELSTDYDNMSYPSNSYELVERWRKQLKLSTLSSITEKLKIEQDLHTADTTYVEKSFDAVEKECRENTKKSMDEFFDNINDLETKDWFSLFLNAITQRYDPHTYYFAPEDKDRFDVSISGKLEGIGARLQKKNDYTEITELISGGPAWRGQLLEAGDLILKVAQGNKEAVDILGLRLDDVVKIIKGPKGTEVRLTVKKVDGRIKVISIIRDIVEIEETYIKSSLIEKDGKKYGLINLPKFYIDFEEKKSRNASTDMAIEIERLKKAGVEGIVVDLRGNGGGSLKTVVDIGGYFIEQGPIVQVKSTGKKQEVLSDDDKNILWDGPLVILVNDFSASASEILAAAVQDYKRGVIIGSKQTYGKGTVQNVVDLNQLMRGNTMGDLGALKTTTQKFYRISGGSTQLEGVKSDVVVPNKYTYLKIGEKDIENPMPWDKIDPAPYKPYDFYTNLNSVINRSKQRVKTNTFYQLIDEDARRIQQMSDRNKYDLQIDSFKVEQARIDESAKKFKAISDYKFEATFSSLAYENSILEKDTILASKRDKWHKSLAKDLDLEEALHVLSELKMNKKKKKR